MAGDCDCADANQFEGNVRAALANDDHIQLSHVLRVSEIGLGEKYLLMCFFGYAAKLGKLKCVQVLKDYPQAREYIMGYGSDWQPPTSYALTAAQDAAKNGQLDVLTLILGDAELRASISRSLNIDPAKQTAEDLLMAEFTRGSAQAQTGGTMQLPQEMTSEAAFFTAGFRLGQPELASEAGRINFATRTRRTGLTIAPLPPL